VLAAFSVAYWTFAILTMPLFFGVGCAVRLVTFPFDRRRLANHLWSCVWAHFYIATNPLWRARVSGRERCPWRGAAIYVANHTSIMDIAVMYLLYRPFKWIAKAELMKTPFIGWNMRLNDYVEVARGDRESIKVMMARCRGHLAAGSPLMMFPEGTRSPDGRLQAFKDGAFKLAIEAGCPVIPCAISGTGESMPKHGIVMRQRMDARLQVLEPLHPKDFPTTAALRDEARRRIAEALGEPHPLPAPGARAPAGERGVSPLAGSPSSPPVPSAGPRSGP
jgi:1-acyl-sn-glycerol-3-phosphate acyltransferase